MPFVLMEIQFCFYAQLYYLAFRFKTMPQCVSVSLFFSLTKTTSVYTVAASGVGQNSDKLLKTIQTPCQIV